MECVICKNVSFHQDEQGNYFCGVCGTQSQEYFAESFELEENLQGGQIRSIKQKFVRAPKEVAAAPDTLDMLLLFQHVLKLYTKVVKKHLSEHMEFVPMVRRLWLKYLRLWHESGGSLTPDKPPPPVKRKHTTANSIIVDEVDASIIKEEDPYHVDSDDNTAPAPAASPAHAPATTKAPPKLTAVPLPSPALLLSIIYIAIRQLRLSFLLCDLVRLLHSGDLPLFGLLEHLPQELCRNCTIAQRRLLMPHYHGATHFPTVMNLWYHTTRVADLLGIVLAPLNSPLIAQYIISQLGLPHIVYRNYCLLTHVLDETQCLKVMNQENQQHVVNILAAIVVSCKLAPNWSCWSYIDTTRNHSDIESRSKAPVITSPAQLHLINRTNLDSYLRQVLATTRPADIAASAHRTTGQFSFNAIVSSYMHASPTLLQLSLDEPDGDCDYDTSVHAQHQPRGSHIRYLRYPLSTDKPGKLLPAYAVLLEHCAQYLYISPTMLYEMVNTIDAHLFRSVNVHGERRAGKHLPEPNMPPLPIRRSRHAQTVSGADRKRRKLALQDAALPLQIATAAASDPAEDADASDSSSEESDEEDDPEELETGHSAWSGTQCSHSISKPGRILLTINDTRSSFDEESQEAVNFTGGDSSGEGEDDNQPTDLSEYVSAIVEV